MLCHCCITVILLLSTVVSLLLSCLHSPCCNPCCCCQQSLCCSVIATVAMCHWGSHCCYVVPWSLLPSWPLLLFLLLLSYLHCCCCRKCHTVFSLHCQGHHCCCCSCRHCHHFHHCHCCCQSCHLVIVIAVAALAVTRNFQRWHSHRRSFWKVPHGWLLYQFFLPPLRLICFSEKRIPTAVNMIAQGEKARALLPVVGLGCKLKKACCYTLPEIDRLLTAPC